jgi:hypothetical protein
LSYDGSDDLIDAMRLMCVSKMPPLKTCPSDCTKAYQSTIEEITKMLSVVCAGFVNGIACVQLLPS